MLRRVLHCGMLATRRMIVDDAKAAVFLAHRDPDQPSTSSSSSPSTTSADDLAFQDADTDETALIEDQLLESGAERFIAALQKVDEGLSVVGTGLVKEPVKKIPLKEMESAEDTLSRPINNWRAVVYSEGELEHSDLSKPPSKKNPHPFEPAKNSAHAAVLPPTHARSLMAYANHSKVVQRLLDLGVDLLDVDTKTPRLSRHLVRADWDRDVLPRLAWLVRTLGVDHETLGPYLTRNPFFLMQRIEDMQARVNYLKSKKLTKRQICKIVTENRYWLNTDVATIDSRLGWLQRQFNLTGNEMRDLIVKEPRVIIFGLGPLQRLVLLFNKECRFAKHEVKGMLLNDPRLFMMDPKHVQASYNYMVLVMGLTNRQIAAYPLALRCSVAAIRRRHEFAKRTGKAVYEARLPGYVSLEALLQPSDRRFAEDVCRVRVADFNLFMKTL